MEKSSDDAIRPIRVKVTECDRRVSSVAQAMGVSVKGKGGADPVCALARVLVWRGVDRRREVVIHTPEGYLRAKGASLGWWADHTMTEGDAYSVRITKFKEFAL
jgi:hypothetical protein